MDELKNLEEACKKEKDAKICTRMHAVRMVRICGLRQNKVAVLFNMTDKTVSKWVKRFDNRGVEALSDISRSGRPPKVEEKIIQNIIRKEENGFKTLPVSVKQDIQEQTGVSYRISYVRKLMRRFGLSPKRPRLYHIKKAKKHIIKRWQYRLKRRILRLKKKKFIVFLQDESIFIQDPKTGQKYWTKIGHPPTFPYHGKHKKTVVYGAVSYEKKGRHFFKQYDKFNGPNFVSYLKELQRKFGKIAVIVDKAPQHRSEDVKELLRENKNIRLIYLPTGSPELNIVEWYWAMAKRKLLVSEYYPTLENMMMAISEYFRTLRCKISPEKFLYRKILEYTGTNL